MKKSLSTNDGVIKHEITGSAKWIDYNEYMAEKKYLEMKKLEYLNWIRKQGL